MRLRTTLLALTAGAACAALTACGSTTKTVSAAETPSPQTTSSTQTETHATTATSPTATTPPPTGGATAPTTTRTASEPAFAEHEAGGEAAAAAALVRAHGYTPVNVGEYHPNQTLRVLVATRTGSGDGYGQQAFFFVDGHYIGTDAKEPSASVKVVSQGDTEVALAYPLYRASDPLCCPGGGQATVHFQLDNGRLSALEPIPPASSKTTLSRY